jgi:hypothetical protein
MSKEVPVRSPLAVSVTAGLLLLLSFTAQAARQSEAEEAPRPAPRWPDGRINLGPVPGGTGTWGGSGAPPILVEIDSWDLLEEYAQGRPLPININRWRPTAELDESDPDRFPKPKLSEVPFQPWARALFHERLRNEFEPYTRCKPSGGSRQVATAYGTQFVDMPGLERIYIVQTGGPRSYRIIYMDGRDHPEDLSPTYYGHSVGRWAGDTLIVDTVGFNEKMWIDREGVPFTEQLRLVERFTRTSFDQLTYEIRIEDPMAYTEPWESGFYMSFNEGGESFEFVCQDGNRAGEMMVGTDYTFADRSSPVVP